ncbi:MAG: type II secretion system GspH family protein [Blautia sp.]|nr:type II secretion system GspH family protein [Lachnoclostridium sp.]MCM1210396.1 type II secretion system GspH family protein [Blautia sp.]
MKDNKGMSLVELLISVTILAIVIVSAAAFMVTGSRSFARGSANSNVQSEAELAVNQVEDLVIDVNGGVDYLVDDTADTEELVMYHVENDDSGVTTYKKRTVTWDRAGETLKSSEWDMDYDEPTNHYVEKAEVYKDQLLADNVTDFNVDLSDSEVGTASNGTPITIVRSVVIRVDCHDATTGNVAYATTPVITLRNRLMRSATPEAIFPETPAGDSTLVLYISDSGLGAALPIVNRVTTVERDKLYNIFAIVNLGSDVNDQCDWTIEGESAGSSCLSTIDASGVLSVAELEPNDYLVITATYKNNSNKKVVGVVKVIGGSGGGSGKSLDSVKIIPTNMTTFAPNYASDVRTSGTWTQAELNDLDYTWSISEPERVASFDNKGKSLALSIIQEEQNYGKIITITLVVHSDVTGQTVSDQVQYRIANKGTKPGGDDLLERGKVGDVIGYHGDNWYSFEPPFYDENPVYEYYFCDIEGNRISAHDSLLDCIVISGGHGSYYLSFTKDLPPEREYYIKVMVHYHDKWKGTDWDYERIHYIPAVSLWGETTYCNATVNSGCEFYYNIGGYYELAWANSNPPVYEYEVVDLVYDAPEGVTVTATAAGAQARTVTRIWSRAVFDCSDWNKAGSITLKSMTIKITMKGYPDIYTYSTVLFQ